MSSIQAKGDPKCIGCPCCTRPWNQGSDYCDNCQNDSEFDHCHVCDSGQSDEAKTCKGCEGAFYKSLNG